MIRDLVAQTSEVLNRDVKSSVHKTIAVDVQLVSLSRIFLMF